MATYDSLTPKNKADIAAAEMHYRRFLKRFAQLLRDVDFVNSEAFINSVVDPLISSLDVGEVIPNSSGFIGSTGFTKAQFQALQTFVRGLKTTLDNNQNGLNKAIGINAND